MTERRAEKIYSGIPASGGIAVGPIAHLARADEEKREAGSPGHELEVFTAALAAAKAGLERIIAEESDLAGEILEFQVALIEDEDFIAPVLERITAGEPAHESWAAVLDGEIADYRSGDDEYMSARADDLTDLKRRVLEGIHDTESGPHELPDGAIVIADDMTPSQFLGLDWRRLAGAVILGGSPTSHVAILARARNISLVVGLEAGAGAAPEGAEAILDAPAGTLVCDPVAERLAEARAKAAALEDALDEAARNAARPALTTDGVAVKVMMNVDDPAALADIPPEICDGVGLTRTEFLFEGKALPDEAAQYDAYTAIVRWAAGRPVTLRTLDAGGDKPIPGVTIDGEVNPFLGVRGARLSLRKPEVLKVQLRAMARAAALGPVKVLVPMITVPKELDEVLALLVEALCELEAEGVDYKTPQLGIMIEVPAAALMAEQFDADFYSIGSNDLTQYATAAARDSADMAELATLAAPAVLELIGRTVQAGQHRAVEVSLCGEMASRPEQIPALLAAGLRVFSVAPAQIGRVKQCIRRYDSAGKGDGTNG